MSNCFVLFVYRISPFNTKTLKDVTAKTFLKKTDMKPSALTRYFNRWSKKKYYSKKSLKKAGASFRRAIVTGNDHGLFLHVSIDMSCTATEKEHKLLYQDFSKQVEIWYEKPEKHIVKGYSFDFENAALPGLIVSEAGVIFTDYNKKYMLRQTRNLEQALNKAIETHDTGKDIMLPLPPNYTWNPQDWNNWLFPSVDSVPINPHSESARKRLLEEYQKDIDKYMIGNCSNTHGILTGTPLANLAPYQIFQMKNMSGDVVCFDIGAIHSACKQMGYYYNPLSPRHAPLKKSDRERLGNLFLINGLDPIM